MDRIAPVPLREVDHSVGRLFVKEVSPAGPAPLGTPILMVHGGLHGWWAFETWLPFFAAAGWPSYALSLRNHTGSYAAPEAEFLRLKVADYVEDVLRVAAWLGRPPVLMGHSMGGIIVQKAAEAITPRALVLLCSVGPGQLGRIRDPLPTDRPLMFTPEQARQIWFQAIDDESFAAFYRRLGPESPSVLNDYSGGRITVERGRIRCPVLAVGAEHDRTPVHRAPDIARFYGAECLVVPEAGHNFMLEAVSLRVAVRVNHWLLSALADELLPLGRA